MNYESKPGITSCITYKIIVHFVLNTLYNLQTCRRKHTMFHGPILLLIFMFAIAFIIVMTAKVKMNAFLVLLLASFGVGVFSGMEPVTVIKTITDGFGGILGYIGIVIICGTVIGTILEKSNATLTMANSVLNLIGKTKSALAMSVTGAIVSIAVFCDS